MKTVRNIFCLLLFGLAALMVGVISGKIDASGLTAVLNAQRQETSQTSNKNQNSSQNKYYYSQNSAQENANGGSNGSQSGQNNTQNNADSGTQSNGSTGSENGSQNNSSNNQTDSDAMGSAAADASSRPINDNGYSRPAASAQENVKTPLNISLSGEYLSAYNKTACNLGNSQSDYNKKLVTKIALQILQSNVIKYENQLHFYALSYKGSGGTPKAVYYNLENCISRINKGERIYTDCFGFVRLAHAIACYQICPSDPSSVQSLSGLYGYKGAYSQGKSFSALSSVTAGSVIYDLSGGGRHVAMFLYSNGNDVVYCDQGGLKSGEYLGGGQIYSPVYSNPYRYTASKSYC